MRERENGCSMFPFMASQPEFKECFSSLLSLVELSPSCKREHEDVPSCVKHPKGQVDSFSKPSKEGIRPQRSEFCPVFAQPSSPRTP